MDLANKLCIVTGANSGIGKEAVRGFARRGAYVVMVCRNEQRANRARQELISDTGHTGIEVILADLSIQHDVRETARQIAEKFETVDILVNNAGLIAGEREETIDGIEKTLAVNHLAPFLLTNLLLDNLMRAPDARIINVASEAHRNGVGAFDIDNLQLKENYSSYTAYRLSKLCNIMFTHELAKRCEETSVTTFSLHPGVVQTRLAEQAGWMTKFFYFIGRPFMRSAEKAAETIIYLATADDIRSESGKYFQDNQPVEPASVAFNNRLTEELWRKSEELTGLS